MDSSSITLTQHLSFEKEKLQESPRKGLASKYLNKNKKESYYLQLRKIYYSYLIITKILSWLLQNIPVAFQTRKPANFFDSVVIKRL